MITDYSRGETASMSRHVRDDELDARLPKNIRKVHESPSDSAQNELIDKSTEKRDECNDEATGCHPERKERTSPTSLMLQAKLCIHVIIREGPSPLRDSGGKGSINCAKQKA